MENVNTDVNVEVKPANEEVEPKEELVPKKAYSEVTKDMLKYKTKSKELEAQIAQFKAEKEALENKSLEENQQWKALYEKKKVEAETYAKTLQEKDSQFIGFHKKQAVLKDLGGFKKDEYNSFINLDSIEVDENGNINPESVSKEVVRLRQSYPELLKAPPAANLPSDAPKSFEMKTKAYNDLSPKEREELKRKLILEKQKKV